MADIDFTIPTNRSDLLSELGSNYTVKNVLIPAEISQKLSQAQDALREDGPYYILDNFDTYYSILHHAKTLRPDVVHQAYKSLNRAAIELNDAVQLLLRDPDSLNDEVKTKMIKTVKMLLYIYIQFVVYFEDLKKKKADDLLAKGKPKSTDFSIDKCVALKNIGNIIQSDINLFWESGVVSQDFIDMIAEICFVLLQNPAVKAEKAVVGEIFGVLGNLIKSYDYGMAFVARLIRSIRMYEHVVHCVPEGVKLIVDQFKLQTLVHHLVQEATEWQADETFQDVAGTRCCSLFLTEMALIMPELMLPEVKYLDKYLAHESVPLRVAVLNVLSEVVLQALTKNELSVEERESRDDFFETMIEHLRDVAALVRSRVIQNLIKMQKENAIPISYQNDILSEVIMHLQDKATIVKKYAISCIVAFLEYNPYGANLQLKKCQELLAEKKKLLEVMESGYKQTEIAKIDELEKGWNEIKDELQEEISKYLEEDEEENDENVPPELETDQAVHAIRKFLQEKKYKEAFYMCRDLKNSLVNNNMRKQNEVLTYMTLFHSFYLNTVSLMLEIRTEAGMSPEDIGKIEALENIIKYFEDTVQFLTIIDSAIDPLKKLINSQTMSDFQEAIQFFVIANQFQIDRAAEGIFELLKLMACSEQGRQAAVADAFKTIYLTTDTKNMTEHTTTVLNRLVTLYKDLTAENVDNFEQIIKDWTCKGILDNSVIDRCWHYYTQREPVSNEEARIAAELLRMAALGRKTIITKNVNVVATVIFSEQHKNDMMFVASSLRLLAAAGCELINIQSENIPFCIKHSDDFFQNLGHCLVENFFKKEPCYYAMMTAAMQVIGRVSSNPLPIWESILAQINATLNKLQKKNTFLCIRLSQTLGSVALSILEYLDNTVNRELKRRNYLRDERKTTKKNKRKKGKRSSAMHNMSNASEASVNESLLLGAEATDADAEFILNVLENEIVTDKSFLGQYSKFLRNICERPDLYGSPLLQHAAVTALLRFMLVSSRFCSENIRLIFTLLEKSAYPCIKCTILIHCSDLLVRFPNIVEPWSHRIYGMLKDQLVEVRKTAFYALSSLILRAMILPHAHISEMAACLIDADREVNVMCKQFFEKLSHKEQTLVNVIPDIFTNIVRMQDIDQQDIRHILKFLFDLIHDSKKKDSLVDRFCSKFTPDENFRLNRNIAYCLSLIQYDEKALRKLREKFEMYRHHLHDSDIYTFFKNILQECSKPKAGKADKTDLKPIVSDIEACIASVFELNEDGKGRSPPMVKPKAKAKSTRKRSKKSQDDEDKDEEPKRSRRGRRKQVRSESEESDEEPRKAAPRGRKKEMSSDSE